MDIVWTASAYVAKLTFADSRWQSLSGIGRSHKRSRLATNGSEEEDVLTGGEDTDDYDSEGFYRSSRRESENESLGYDPSNIHDATAPYEVRRVIMHKSTGERIIVHTRQTNREMMRPRIVRSVSSDSTSASGSASTSELPNSRKRLTPETSSDDISKEQLDKYSYYVDISEEEVVPQAKQRKWVATTEIERQPLHPAKIKANQTRTLVVKQQTPTKRIATAIPAKSPMAQQAITSVSSDSEQDEVKMVPSPSRSVKRFRPSRPSQRRAGSSVYGGSRGGRIEDDEDSDDAVVVTASSRR